MNRGIFIVSCGDTDCFLPMLTASIERHTRLPFTVHQDPTKGGIRSREIKLRMCELSPYDQTLYVDVDAILCADPEPLFDLLQHDCWWMASDVGPKTITEILEHRFYKLVASKTTTSKLAHKARIYPNTPHFNSGVILFDRRALSYFTDWRKIWESLPPGQDQLALILSIAGHPKRRPSLLSPCWNFQHSFTKAEADLTTYRSQIRILHLSGQRKPELYQRAHAAGYIDSLGERTLHRSEV